MDLVESTFFNHETVSSFCDSRAPDSLQKCIFLLHFPDILSYISPHTGVESDNMDLYFTIKYTIFTRFVH